MKFSASRETILKPLHAVIGVVERRQTMPILSNVLLVISDGKLMVTATDLEVELLASTEVDVDSAGEITVPGRKLHDICKALPDEARVEISVSGDRVTLKAGRSRFTLSALRAADFPIVDEISVRQTLRLDRQKLRHVLEQTQFSMAQQDVRYYLNGILMEISRGSIKLVATDGHRLALSEYQTDIPVNDDKQVIVPRKGVMELARLLDASDDPARVVFSQNHIRVEAGNLVFTSKLIDGKFPDYNRVIPADGNKTLSVDREFLKKSMNRIAILSNEKYRGIRLSLTAGNLSIQANNPDQEEAEEELTVDYDEGDMEIGFNVTYLIDVLTVLQCEKVNIKLKDANSSCIISDSEDSSSLYVVMPMRL